MAWEMFLWVISCCWPLFKRPFWGFFVFFVGFLWGMFFVGMVFGLASKGAFWGYFF